LAFDETTEKAFCSPPIAAALHQNINHIAILGNGTPEIVALALNCDKDFVDVPGFAQASLSFFELARIVWPKLPTPLTYRFIGDSASTFGKKFFHLTKIESEPMVQPGGVSDNFRGKTVTLIAELMSVHTAQSGN